MKFVVTKGIVTAVISIIVAFATMAATNNPTQSYAIGMIAAALVSALEYEETYVKQVN